MIWTIVVILAVLWLLGLTFKVGGKIIHILIVIGLILIALKILQLI